MSGVKRVFVEKKKPYAVKAKELYDEITDYLGIKNVTGVRVLIRYDIENLSDEAPTYADVDGDGKITLTDCSLVLKAALGIIELK